MSTELGTTLLRIARGAIAARLGTGELARDEDPRDPRLDRHGATFVTLTRQRALRGCIGTLDAHRPLREDVLYNACAAAFGDPRFPPVTAHEFPALRVEVSLLSEPEPLAFRSEAEALAQLRPGVDGVILMFGRNRATFLPQVWESLPEVEDFMGQLKRKAGLPADFWHPDFTLARYQAQKWKEEEPRSMEV